MTHSLDAVFRPRSVAVIGATRRKGTIGHEILRNVVQYGFNGMVFPVNPNYRFIQSTKCYPRVSDIPDPVDLAIVVVPKDHVVDVVAQCGEKGVQALVIISAGFREVGPAGAEREAQLVALQGHYGFRIVGPNCMGVINADPDVRLNATFAPVEPDPGSLAFMTQSGALGVAILLAANKLDFGISYFVSVGNKADVSGNDLLEYWAEDDKARIIAMYLESFGDPRRFTQLSRRITRKKPVIVVKSGTTAAGARAASSHTGHLAGLEIAVDALMHQCGVIRVSTIDEMMDLVLAFSKNPLPAGHRVGVLTNAGGPGIMATDSLVNEGLSVAELSGGTRKKLRAILPAESSVRNPVDMIASAGPEQYGEALEIMLGDPGVDAVIVIFVPPIMIEPRAVVERITAATRSHGKPVFCVLMAKENEYVEIPRLHPDAPPLYRYPESAVRALSAMTAHRDWRRRPAGKARRFDVRADDARKVIARAAAAGGGYLSPADVSEVLESYGFPVCASGFVPPDGDAAAVAARVGYPVVLKAFGRAIVHKSDIGGVAVDIPDAASLAHAHAEMKEKLAAAGAAGDVEGFLVQEMARPGKEVILGMATDEKFGPLLMFGMGGKYVEIIKDITFRVMPVTDVDAAEMVRGIRSFLLLEGVRGETPVDIGFIEESIQRLAQLVDDLPRILEIDMNPVIVVPDRSHCRVVDARIRIREG